MRKSRYQVNSSVEQLPAHLPDEKPQQEDKQHLASLPKLGGPSEEKQCLTTLAKHHDALASDQTKPAAYKAREEHITVETSKRCDRVGGQAKVSIIWLQGSLFLGNLVVLFTAVVTLVAWYQLRQEHLLALNETSENQGVVVQAIEGGWRLEVGLVVTGLGLVLHWLVGGVIMPLRISDCKGFALGTFLIFNVAVMLWQVCAALAIFHILPAYPSFSHMTPGTERFLIRWGSWLVASYLSCLPVQLISAAVHISFDSHQEVAEESVQLRRNIDRDGQALARVKPKAAVGSERASQVRSGFQSRPYALSSGSCFLRH